VFQDIILRDPAGEEPTASRTSTGVVAPAPTASEGFSSALDREATANAAAEAELGTPVTDFVIARREQRLAAQGDVMGGMPRDQGVAPTVTPTRRETFSDRQLGVYLRGQDEMYDTYKPRYFEGDYQDIMATWSIDRIQWFQDRAMDAGMLNGEEFSFRYGSRDANTRNAFSFLLADANANGNEWEDQLQDNVRTYQEWLKENPEPEDEKYPSFVTPAYLAPDYATLAQQTKSDFNARLGRRATGAEMRLFTDYLGGQDAQQWAAQTQADRQTHAARAREFETGDPQGGGTVQGVDAMARFDEFFDEKYEGEIKHRERTEDVQRRQPGLFGSLNRIAGSI
jgi:hypothetical protein